MCWRAKCVKCSAANPKRSSAGAPQAFDMFQSGGGACATARFNCAEEGETHRPHAAEAQNAVRDRPDAVSMENEPIDKSWHAHGDDEARRPALEPGVDEPAICRSDETVTRNLFKKGMQERRRAAEPQRKENDDMVCPQEIVTGLHDRIRLRRRGEIARSAKQRKCAIS